ncbi:MAG: hypothetical protein JJD92_10545 [Frankiaceae bacterium]|nr:hypothetical protein [Frankiaceae bacterium]
MLQTKNLRTVAIGVSALGVAAAGIATVAMGDSPSGRHGSHAGASAGRTTTAQADISHLGSLGWSRSAFDGPAAASRTTDRPMSPSTASTRRTSPTSPTSLSVPAAAHKPLVSAHVGGPVTVQVDTDQVLATANSAVKTAANTVNNTVTWAKTTVDRTVQSLPVKASVKQDQSGTTVSVSAAGTTASAHVG